MVESDEKAKRWRGFMESLDETKRKIDCLMASRREIHCPLAPDAFMSASICRSVSMQNSISSGECFIPARRYGGGGGGGAGTNDDDEEFEEEKDDHERAINGEEN